jgi:ABC-2 type transport system ATP-binding protein
VVCDGVTRSVHRERLLDRLDLAVGVGARLLVVSTPEASASLLLRVLAGLARATSGIVRIAGVTRADDSAAGWARRIGYVGPEAGIHPWMSPGEALDLAGRLAGLDPDERRRRIDEAAELYRLGAQLGTPVRRGGPALAQRTALAAAMLAEPEVLLLDEPLRSLEPDERRLLLTIPGRRRTVLLASRYPASEAGLVNQVALLREGRIVLHVGIAELDEHDLQLSMRGIEALAKLGLAGVPGAAAVGQ